MKIIIIGAGTFGTALATALCKNQDNEIVLWTHLPEEASEINKTGINEKYFPNRLLDKRIIISSDKNIIMSGELIFLAIPSGVIESFINLHKKFIHKSAVIVNLSKGLFPGGITIPERLEEILKNPVVSLKGPSFAVEVMNDAPTIFTLGFSEQKDALKISGSFMNTNLFLDYTIDIRGVELLSVLKNIYAIFIGVVDARYNSPNTRFMMLTKAYNEMRFILEVMGGKKDTVFLSCGFGDFGLTALNDLSRNRTLGLLIGKGFYDKSNSDSSVVLEGVNSVKMIYNSLNPKELNNTPLLKEIYSFFENPNSSDFQIRFRKLINMEI